MKRFDLSWRVVIGLGAIVLVLIGILAIVDHENSGITDIIQGGGHVQQRTDHIAVPGVNRVTVATSEAACELMRVAYRDKDERTLSALILSGSMFSADNFCEVDVLERKANSVKVRILTGTQAQETGWVPVGFLD
jgi:hypothetical protein